MRQEVEFFEKQQVEALPSKMATYFTQIAEGSGEKTGQMLSTIGSTLSGVIIGLVMCPYYALCLLFYLPFATILLKRLQGKLIFNVVRKGMMNGKLGGFTEELLGALKLIISFGKENKKLD
jgi:ABC-type multidrug transport system fused ATPase/permease subunit